ncbi:2-C-methyl-D-erythritol 4-phosphate cytidylyltransferase [Cellulomonas chitinilytica]|uniref:2-C-methyl-D-erythritol 4-phosphate cytidylyltransferase n=1 Tax=Cellulomonas chitinilytica TaxID=398759 RepID=A0A919P335_9CELL|nr:2-C-methyl-D-erythritol 4-phosphate cytidylyltransferase [Cellulomonas chitinilytica]GIG22526.1 2-C-methyl-D-erythritol 4-phosphate cytidylyltransferase [Cellulomonas chitinilytica]
MSVAAVLTAAGSGSRLGHALPKALVPLAGEPLVRHAARRLLAARAADGQRIETLVVTAPADHVAHVERSLTGLADGVRVVVVAGGPTRQASVAAALAVLGAPVPSGASAAGVRPTDDAPGDPTVVLVHDAARPLAPEELVGRVIDAVRAGRSAVVPGMPVTDTIKQVDAPQGAAEGLAAARVLATVAREQLRAVQTPQGFTFDVLRTAHAAAAAHAHDEALAASDDAGLVERTGGAVWVVDGDERAAKITTPRDLAIAELLLRDERAAVPADDTTDGAPRRTVETAQEPR